MILELLVHFLQKFFKQKKKINYSGYAIPRYKGIDVDTYEDWDLLTKIIKKK